MRKTAAPHARAIALDATPARLAAAALLVLALLALLLPWPGHAAPPAAQVQLVTAGETARVVVDTIEDRAVTVEWGLAPYASHVRRSASGRHHALELGALTPGGVYVYSVRVGGVLVAPPRPFVMPGAAPHVPAAQGSLPL